MTKTPFFNASLFSKDNVNTSRQLEVDLVKVLAILTMVLVHVFEFSFTIDDVGKTVPMWLTLIIEFCGGPLSAPLFMTAMGVGMAYARKQDALTYASRGKILIRQGYDLNFWRGGLLYLVIYTITKSDSSLFYVVQGMLVLDILHFAGMAFLFLALLKLLKMKPGQILLVGIVMEVIATLMPPVAADSVLGAGALGLLFFQNQYTTFPLFSWFIYPAIGYFFGHMLLRVTDKKRFYQRILIAATGVFIAYTGVLLALRYDLTEIFLGHGYYAQGLLRATWILPICALVYSLFYFVSPVVKGKGKKLAEFISSKVNDIYIAQWILITWTCTILAEYTAPTVGSMIALVCIITVLSVALAYGRSRRDGRFFKYKK